MITTLVLLPNVIEEAKQVSSAVFRLSNFLIRFSIVIFRLQILGTRPCQIVPETSRLVCGKNQKNIWLSQKNLSLWRLPWIDIWYFSLLYLKQTLILRIWERRRIRLLKNFSTPRISKILEPSFIYTFSLLRPSYYKILIKRTIWQDIEYLIISYSCPFSDA